MADVPAPVPPSERRPGGLRRMGLQARLSTAFALGALVLSASLASVTYVIVRQSLVRQRETSATNEAFLNARQLRDSLPSAGVDEQVLLDQLQNAEGGGNPVLLHDGSWFGGVERSREDLPARLREMVLDGDPARLRYELDEQTHLAVGVPLPAVNAAYFEITSFVDLEDTLGSLGVTLLIVALVTTVLGAALGASASRRVLRPLAHVSAAAEAIAGGRLDTRVATIDEADLGTLVTSFNEMAAALQARIEADARFASDVSHELRSPLTTLSASVEVLHARRHEMPERARSALDLLAADVARFSAMVEDLLEISRFDAGAAHLDLEEVRISELVAMAVAASTDDDVPVVIGANAADRVVQADKRRLVRVVANLVDNAARHGDGAEDVSVALAGSTVRIAVEDAGPGVAPADRERIFERFARGAAAGRRGDVPGSGLGLSLVRGHVELHGGRVWVEDRRAQRPGARFVVELPLAAPAPPPAVADLGPASVPAANT